MKPDGILIFSHFCKAKEKQCRRSTHPLEWNHLLHLRPILSKEDFYGISYQAASKDASEMTFPGVVIPTLLNLSEIT